MILAHFLCLVMILKLCLCEDSQESGEESASFPDMPPNPFANKPATFHWPQAIVPYYIDPESYDNIIANRIRKAMRTIEGASCVVFKEIAMAPLNKTATEYSWLMIENPDDERECTHRTLSGDTFGKAVLVIGYDCMQTRDILHGLMHVLGFNDEVTHPQRDMYIRILWSNIQPKYRPLFWMHTSSPFKTLVEYDTMSIMHFHDRAYSINGGATITPLISGLLINPSDQLSQLDSMKLRLAFGHECNKRKVGNLFQTCENVLKGAPGPAESGDNDSKSDGSKDQGIIELGAPDNMINDDAYKLSHPNSKLPEKETLIGMVNRLT